MSEPTNKYLRKIYSATTVGASIEADVYEVLAAFGVVCPARQHAIKKLLLAGYRSTKSQSDDLREAAQAIERARQMQGRGD